MQIGDLVKHRFRKKDCNIGLVIDIVNDNYTKDGKRYIVKWNNTGVLPKTATTSTLIIKL